MENLLNFIKKLKFNCFGGTVIRHGVTMDARIYTDLYGSAEMLVMALVIIERSVKRACLLNMNATDYERLREQCIDELQKGEWQEVQDNG